MAPTYADLLLLLLSALAIINLDQIFMANGGMHNSKTENVEAVKGIDVGAIVDLSARIGKEEAVAMQMAAEDARNQTRQRLTLLLKNSQGEAVQAVLAARHLIKKKQVLAILGPGSGEETFSVAEVGTQFDVPILSLADSCPSWGTKRWPFLVQASPSKNLQMKAVAAVVQSWGWRRVNVIYEDIDSSADGITPHLYDALQEVGAQISHLTALPSLANASTLSEELHMLKRDQCRVFVVHVTLALGVRLFNMVKEKKMMERGYVWITTDSLTSLVHSMDASTISSMQGVLGIKSYYDDKGQKYQDFFQRFQYKFGLKHPEEKNHEPGNSALEAYDAIWTVALALQEGNINHQLLLDKISTADFPGVSGKIHFSEQRLAPANVFQITNVIGRSYREVGFWSYGKGFSMSVDETAQRNVSMEVLGQLFWPGGPPDTPKGWDIPTASSTHLRIGVPSAPLVKYFVKVEIDPITKGYSFSGFSIDVFRESVKYLPYFLGCDFIPFEGTYDALVEQVRLKNFDAAVGDIAIVSERYVNADFTQPHTESGLVLIVPTQSQSKKGWLFLEPFTSAMWLLTALVHIYNGFVIWMIERNYCPELKGSPLNQMGTLLWLAFATLFSLHGDRLHSNLSRMATVVWLFVAVIISQSYTASLTSMLTLPRLEPKVANIETLRNSNAVIGHSSKAFVRAYLLNVLHFNPNNIKNFSSFEECAEDLKNGRIAGAFLEVPTSKVFLAKYCKSFMTAGPTYKAGGYGFAFSKGSPLIADMDEALLKVFESGRLKELEDNMTALEKCVEIESESETLRLSPSSFYILFMFTGGTSTAALAIYFVHSKFKVDNTAMREHKRIWLLILLVLKHWRNKRAQFPRNVSLAETPVDASSHV
ncbi:glutamate receptor 2.7-like [Coffea arabica]|uniref:Glutamate receptor n=1 Tax=Coffea arabica TaxID=13443 RepID=A0A6P6S511_COFAR|nr:glutamate receptor 2.7-like [Coffea arabica]